MYWQDKWIIKDSIEYEIKYLGSHGERNSKRGKRKKATPEIIKKQNQRNREKRMRRLIKANFDEGDLWLTIKYIKGTRKPMKEIKSDLRRFIDTLRRKYKKCSAELKFIYRIEIGSQGGIHIHMIVPRIRGADTELMIQEVWKHGRINYQTLDDGNYAELAAYIVKQPDEEIEKQLKLFPEEERKELIKVSTSRNLIRPSPERKVYHKRTVKKLIREGPTPTKGFYIVKDSIHIGINPYTGMSYIHYTERKVRGG